MGHQPLGTAWAAGALERAGFAPTQVDLARTPLDPALVARARFVAISVPMHTALRLGARTADRIRPLNPVATLCLYGLYAWLNAEHLLAHHADVVLGGEVEGSLVALVEDLERGGAGEAPGVWRRGGPAMPPVMQKGAFGPPSRAGLPPLSEYARYVGEDDTALAGYVEASRGCLHTCLHCPIPPVYDGRFFVVPAEVVLGDIRVLVAAGARHITFGDPDFLNGPGHALRLARALHDEFPDVTFDFTAKIEHLLAYRALLPALAKLGCTFIVSAVESLSDVVLARLEKGHTRADVVEAMVALRGAGIALRASLVAFTPWTTIDDYLDVLEFFAEGDAADAVDPVQYAIRLLVPPGSSLVSRPWMQEHLVSPDPAGFTFVWTHPDPRMDRLYRTVQGIVERGTADGVPRAEIVAAIRDAALAVRDGRPPNHRRPPPLAPRIQSPRLTEPWFC
ncbi:MAG TPA: CUAEP/CCAEP-tail radical SAM protein [Gemmatimonadales bacterium]|nr:CUAEP/CCAEP-tail radical SAM protein [Gemmatimonadales bacterium]